MHMDNNNKASIFDRLLAPFTKLRPGEGKAVFVYASYAFSLMLAYYAFKVIRESLILTEFTPLVKSGAMAAIAILLFFVIPIYGKAFAVVERIQLVRWITLFFAINIIIFYLMRQSGMEIGFVFYVWTGIFSVMITAQFWAFTADSFNVKSGQRLFALIMAGQALGALIGGKVAGVLMPIVGLENLMLLAGAFLAATVLLTGPARALVPANSAAVYEQISEEEEGNALGGLSMVFASRYLLLVAIIAVLLNWVNSTGEVILSDLVQQFARDRVADDPSLNVTEIIGAFYGNFYTWVNGIGVAVQLFLVSRIYRLIGVSGALLILPVFAMVGYGLIAFVPIFSLLRIVKIIENSTDYSVMNTTRQALYLPLGEREKYEAKTAIDTFFWRFGDLVQFGAVFLVLQVIDGNWTDLAMMNMVLAFVWILVAIAVGKHYRQLVKTNVGNRAPELKKPLPDVHAPHGTTLIHTFAEDTFIDADPGDILTLSAFQQGGMPLPTWMKFDPAQRIFKGTVPPDAGERTHIQVIATDFDGLSTDASFTMHHSKTGEKK